MGVSSVIRSMDFTATNLNESVTWADRPTPTWQGSHPTKGVAWEYAVLLANQSTSDLWVNIPANANDTYITNLANLIKFGSDGTNAYTSVQGSPVWPPLDSGRKIYVEYGNEVWNSGAGFLCYSRARTRAQAFQGSTAHPINYDDAVSLANDADGYTALKRFVAYQSAFISLAFRTVFGDAAMMTRVLPVFCGQANNGNEYFSTGLNWARIFYSAVRATTPPNNTIRTVIDLWYGLGSAAYIDSTSNSPATSTPADLDAYFAGLPAPEFAQRIATDSLWSKAHGLKYLAYEGGPEPGGSYLGSSVSPGAVSAAINNDPRMAGVLQTTQAVWDSYGGDEFVYYIYSGAGNAWSFTNNASPPLVSDVNTPKMQGLAAIASSGRSAATFGYPNVGTFTLKSGGEKVIGSNGAGWYQSGAAYALQSTDYIFFSVLSSTVKSRRLYLKTLNATADQIAVLVNGVSAGTITPAVVSDDTLTTTGYVVVNFVIGVNVVALRKVSSTGNTFVKDIVLSSNSLKTFVLNLSAPVNADLGDSQGSATISRL